MGVDVETEDGGEHIYRPQIRSELIELQPPLVLAPPSLSLHLRSALRRLPRPGHPDAVPKYEDRTEMSARSKQGAPHP